MRSALQLIGNIQNETLGLLPAQAGIGDGLTEDTLLGLAGAVLDVALDHESLDETPDVGILTAAVHHVLGDAGLLQVLLPRVVVVGVHDDRGIDQVGLLVQLAHPQKILVVVVGHASARVVQVAAEDGVGVGVAVGGDFPAAVEEGVAGLGGHDGVHHDAQITARRVLHTHGGVEAAGHQAMGLVLHRAGAHGHVGQEVGEVAVVLGVEHLVGAGEIVVPQGGQVQVADGHDALVHIGLGVGIGLVEHTLVALARGTGLVGVDAGDDDDLIRHLLLNSAETGNVFQHGLLVVSGARADDQDELVRGALKYGADARVARGLDLLHAGGQGVLLLHVPGDGELSVEIHRHDFVPLS